MLSRCSLTFAAGILLLTWRLAIADDAVELADLILEAVAAQKPPGSPPLSQSEIGEVKWAARTLLTESYYPMDGAEARRSIGPAIASAASRTGASAQSLAHAGISALVATMGHGAATVTTGTSARERSQEPAVRFQKFGGVHVFSIARFELAEPCKGIASELSKEGEPKILVLDLRGNEGGVLTAIPEIAGRFLARELPLFKVRDKRGRVSQFSTTSCTLRPSASRLAIWIDQRTDSGALLLAAVLQDHRRAIVLGEHKSSVNGSVSSVFVSPTRTLLMTVPIGELLHAKDRPLRDGVRLDMEMPADDGLALLDATRAHLATAH